MNVTCPNCATVYRVDPAKVPAAGVRARCNVCSAVFAVRREGDAEPTLAASAARPLEQRPPAPTATKPDPLSSPAQPAPPKPPLQSEPLRPAQPVAAPPPGSGMSGGVPPGAPAPARPVGPQRPVAPANPIGPAGIATPASSSTTSPSPTLSPSPPAPRAAPPSAAPPSPAAPKPATPPATPPSAAVPRAAAPAPSTGSRPANPFLSQDPALKARRLARALISDMVVYHPGKRQEGLRDGNLKALFDEEIKKSWEEYAEQVGREVADSTPYFREALNEILAGGRQIF
jgi:predicted Zn finger-like uncharacterized protein